MIRLEIRNCVSHGGLNKRLTICSFLFEWAGQSLRCWRDSSFFSPLLVGFVLISADYSGLQNLRNHHQRLKVWIWLHLEGFAVTTNILLFQSRGLLFSVFRIMGYIFWSDFRADIWYDWWILYWLLNHKCEHCLYHSIHSIGSYKIDRRNDVSRVLGVAEMMWPWGFLNVWHSLCFFISPSSSTYVLTGTTLLRGLYQLVFETISFPRYI